MSIERILSLLPAPINGVETQGHDWGVVRNQYGLDVPEDFKVLLATYGTGSIGGFVWILNPFSRNINLSFDQVTYHQEAYKHMKEEYPEEYPRPALPAPDSFLTWAVTDNGDSLFWVVDDGSPNYWTIGIHSDDQGEEELTGMTTSEFLEALLEKRLTSSILPRQFLEADKSFSPA